MKKIEATEILPIGEYEQIRPHFRARVIREKHQRRVALSPSISAGFENRDTVLLQIQEMLRTERITTTTAVQHEIDTYNELIPAQDELSFTLFIEIADRTEREATLTKLAGLETAVFVEIDGQRIAAVEDLPAAHMPTRTTAVHYFKAPLFPSLASSIRKGSAQVALIIDHPAERLRKDLSGENLRALAGDLAG